MVFRADSHPRYRHHPGSAPQALRQELLAEEDNAADRPYWLLTVAARQHSARAAIGCAEEALTTLDELARPDQRPRAGKERRTR